MDCIIDGAYGVYVPQVFAERFGDKIPNDAREVLEKGPDSQEYWETWDDVLRSVTLRIGNEELILHQGESGDLFIMGIDEPLDPDW